MSIAFMAGVTADFTDRITQWSVTNNPFFDGVSAAPALRGLGLANP